MKSKIKNCAYEGKPKVLESEGVRELRDWCPHLFPANWTTGQEIQVCCDHGQVNFFYASFWQKLIFTLTDKRTDKRRRTSKRNSQPLSIVFREF